VFGRACPEDLPRWDDAERRGTDLWATAAEGRDEIVDRYRRVCAHSDATIDALAVDAPGHVPWWPRPEVLLFNVLVHMVTETNRHAGHADILREQLDGATGSGAGLPVLDPAAREERHAAIERAARDASARYDG
jgi:Protein of unknown function (DUF664)